MLDYVWPAVDAFLRVGPPEDLVTVLPNCRAVCACAGREGRKRRGSKGKNLSIFTPFSRQSSCQSRKAEATVKRRQEERVRDGGVVVVRGKRMTASP